MKAKILKLVAYVLFAFVVLLSLSGCVHGVLDALTEDYEQNDPHTMEISNDYCIALFNHENRTLLKKNSEDLNDPSTQVCYSGMIIAYAKSNTNIFLAERDLKDENTIRLIVFNTKNDSYEVLSLEKFEDYFSNEKLEWVAVWDEDTSIKISTGEFLK